MSESSYKAGDLDSVLVCGQLNDDELEKQNGLIPRARRLILSKNRHAIGAKRHFGRQQNRRR